MRTLISFLCLFFSFSLVGQDISGLWQGVLNVTGRTRYYVSTMTLQQVGSNVTGSNFTKGVVTGFYAVQSVRGTVNNNVFNFEDVALIANQDTFGFTWCMKFGILDYDPALEKLSGVLQTRNCEPETITMELYRLKIYTDSSICSPKNVAIRATGKNLRWYADSTKSQLIYVGDSINPFVNRDTVFYVTQSLYDTESPVVPIVIKMKNAVENQNIKICMGGSVTVGDTIYRTTGQYSRRVVALNGCSSIINTSLTVNPTPQINRSVMFCAGGSVTVGDTIYKTTGIYIKKLKTTEGCDSTITTNLTVKNPSVFAQNKTI
ncbi:MAG: hypothetical protein U5L45_15025 [Saprospiraceae bacterium]|nr:hypothetical protein [Saprospiraceae bacterium]